MGNQKVVRTNHTVGMVRNENRAYKELENLLEEGYKVVMCNPIVNELEYILEKQNQPQEYVANVNCEVTRGKVDANKIYDEIVKHLEK
ncbi:hypothetical protein [Niameybacter massiliensis]|uniref:hypothetical protein n=1 Tax=Niameybacter massiliensis TaxID=1658108 RepID=UPI0006B6925D|nr:hypothetical protein [Niameybacter massiliensis]